MNRASDIVFWFYEDPAHEKIVATWKEAHLTIFGKKRWSNVRDHRIEREDV